MNCLSTLLCYSIENFVSAPDIVNIFEEIAKLKAIIPFQHLNSLTNPQSIHSLPGHSTAEVAAIYSPEGRLEISNLPDSINKIMNEAFSKRLKDIKRAYPSVSQITPWIYLEYKQNQYITPHIDLPLNELDPTRQKLAGISVCLNENYIGGEFYIETSGESDLWEYSGDTFNLRDGCVSHNEWFKTLPKTKWKTKPNKGTAIFFGSQLIHGTEPIKKGKVCKLLSFITE